MDAGPVTVNVLYLQKKHQSLRSTQAGYVFMNLNITIAFYLSNCSLCAKLCDLGVLKIVDQSWSRD